MFDAGQKNAGLYVIRSGSVRLFSEDNGKEVSRAFESGVTFPLRSGRPRACTTCRRVRRRRLKFCFCRAQRRPLRCCIIKDAASFLTSYTAIRMAGGVVSRLFELKG